MRISDWSSDVCSSDLWRQSQFNLRQFKKLYRKAQKLKHSTAQDESKREVQRQAVVQAHEAYVQHARELTEKAQTTLGMSALSGPTTIAQIAEIEGFQIGRAHV